MFNVASYVLFSLSTVGVCMFVLLLPWQSKVYMLMNTTPAHYHLTAACLDHLVVLQWESNANRLDCLPDIHNTIQYNMKYLGRQIR